MDIRTKMKPKPPGIYINDEMMNAMPDAKPGLKKQYDQQREEKIGQKKSNRKRRLDKRKGYHFNKHKS